MPAPRRPAGQPDAPGHLPLWMIFPLLFVGVYLSHITLLRLPYYWDEAGYYIPAAYDFFRTGSLIPSSTLSNAHPPLPSIYLALWWKASGYMPAVTRTAMCLVSSLALLGVYRLAVVLNGRTVVAAATAVLTALYPVWFAQSTLAHADMFAAAATLWGLAFFFQALRPASGRNLVWASVLCFALAALSKETAVVTPVALAVWTWLDARRSATPDHRPDQRPRSRRIAILLLLPLLPLAAWFAYHRWKTGYIFGNPEFLRYNATATLSPARIVLALCHRVLHITMHMNMFVPVLCMAAAMLLVPVTDRNGRARMRISWREQSALYTVIGANVVFFSVVGGALLTRYLLPLYPLVLLLCVATFWRRVPYWWGLAALTAAAFLVGLFVPPPYRFAAEDNLTYAQVIRLQQQGISVLVHRYNGSTVLTAWPATDELRKPELGYVRQPVPVVAIQNFSAPEIQRALTIPDAYTTSFVFSTKDDPGQAAWSLGPRNEALDARYFDFHHDLPPAAIAHLLGGSVVWRADRGAQWAAVLHLDRPQLAELQP